MDFATAWQLGVESLEAEHYDAARQIFSAMLAAGNNHLPIHHALCLIARSTGDGAAASHHAQAVIALAPGSAAAHLLGARVRAETGDWPGLEQSCRDVAGCADRAACDDFVDMLLKIGNRLHAAEHHEAAASVFRAALSLAPENDDAANNLGSTLLILGEFAEAEQHLRRACRAQPALPGPHNNLGSLLRRNGDLATAEACFRTALALAPDHAEARANLATVQLVTGRFAAGWRNLEARWRTAEVKARSFAEPRWNGEILARGKVLLLHAEQGLGDTLQFCRFVPPALARAATIVLEVQRPLHRLLARAFPQVTIVVAGETLPPFDFQCPLMSLPLALDMAEAFGAIPYLGADPAAVTSWQNRLASLPGRRIGLAWQGNQRIASMRRRRDLPAGLLETLTDVPDVAFVSLQKNPVGAIPPLALHDWTAELADMDETAALIQTLDLVIAVDTAIAHLAGALGRPVWLLNRFDTCWRWRDHGEGSDWYPTLRQFRQIRDGDWKDVMRRVAAALRQPG